MKNSNLTSSNQISNKVDIYLYMLRTLILNRIRRQINNSDIITVNKCSGRQRCMQLTYKIPQSTSLGTSISNSMILRLSTRTRKHQLTLKGPKELAALELASLELAAPELAALEFAAPELAASELAAPELAAPELAAPELAAPELAVS
nr:hypothetical protein [Tanacetum cinerariifolium]